MGIGTCPRYDLTAMRREMWFLLLTGVLTCAGFLLGRRFPVHHYEHLAGPDVGYARYLFIDTGTGRVCNAMKPFYDKATQSIDAQTEPNPINQFLSGKVVPPSELDFIPACAKD
jgi:hypothetical protein